MRLGDYFRETRDLATSFFFVAPLLAFYEIGILARGAQVRNGADLLLHRLFGVFGERGVLAFNLLLFLLSVLAGIRIVKRARPVFVLALPVTLESILYAMFFAPAVLFMEYRVVPALRAGAPGGNDAFLQLVLSAGAGVYEELLFRVVLAGSLFHLLERVLGLRRLVAGALAVGAASLLFSLFHHVGPYGEPFAAGVFFFRFYAGVLLSVIFLTRGLAVAVYTHAFYDILLFLQHRAS